VLAEKFSEDDWRVMMGDHKFVHRMNAPPELAGAFSMKAGTTSNIIESPNGFVIIRLNKHTPQKQLTFAEVQSSIRASLEKERTKERSKLFYEGLRAKAKIEVM
jgi:parvulin-like peptidyl-prolyl isomerase